MLYKPAFYTVTSPQLLGLLTVFQLEELGCLEVLLPSPHLRKRGNVKALVRKTIENSMEGLRSPARSWNCRSMQIWEKPPSCFIAIHLSVYSFIRAKDIQ
jgi:hypothetical protein